MIEVFLELIRLLGGEVISFERKRYFRPVGTGDFKRLVEILYGSIFLSFLEID